MLAPKRCDERQRVVFALSPTALCLARANSKTTLSSELRNTPYILYELSRSTVTNNEHFPSSIREM